MIKDFLMSKRTPYMFEYKRAVAPKVKETLQYVKHTFFVAMRSNRDLTKFVGGLVRVTTDTKRQQIYSLQYGHSFSDKLSEFDVKEMYINALELEKKEDKHKAIKIDFVLTTNETYFKGNKEVYLIKSIGIDTKIEEQLINLYINNYQYIKLNARNKIRVPKVNLGEGLIMSDTTNKTALHLDYGELSPIALATMWVMYYAVKADIGKLLNYINK
jgi:hypothetical protein